MYTQEQLKNRQVQGDVVLIPVDTLPEGARLIEGKILQQSEVTGHHHHFQSTANVLIYETGAPAATNRRSITPDDGKYIVVRDIAELYHGTGFTADPTTNKSGDHASQKILPGIYEVRITAEFDYDSMEAVRVID